MTARRYAFPRKRPIVLTAAVLAAEQAGGGARVGLPLGPDGLPETRTTRVVQPGVTLTTIVRGKVDAGASWTVEVAIPSGSSSPDPDAPPAALKDEAAASATAERLRAAGLEARIEAVPTPRLADAGGGVPGYRVRVGGVPTKAEADALRTRVLATGLGGSSVYTGWDGEPDDVAGSTGPWHVQVLIIDPKRFTGALRATYGPDLERRETTSALAALTGATAAVNAGFFVLDPAAGAPGDPAGVAAYDGRLVSEPTAGRPALLVRDDARGTSVTRLGWRGSAGPLRLDGLNRVPGLIRNCGGRGDSPTDSPLHDVTCTDADEIVAFDNSFGASTPSGVGVEVVLDRTDRVVEVRSARATAVPSGGRTVQATGALASELRVGSRLDVRAWLVDDRGRRVDAGRRTTIVNGGPELVRDGRVHATPARDGMAPAGTRASTTAGCTSGTRGRWPVWTPPGGRCW